VDSKNERERLQEAHEQKMHFLHEFHRQQLHAKDHEIAAREHKMSAREMERRAMEAEERAERMARSVMEVKFRAPGEGQRSEKSGDGIASGGGKTANGSESAGEDKENEVWRVMSAAREDQDDGADGGGVVKQTEKDRHQ
jgi:hypothetical protein